MSLMYKIYFSWTVFIPVGRSFALTELYWCLKVSEMHSEVLEMERCTTKIGITTLIVKKITILINFDPFLSHCVALIV